MSTWTRRVLSGTAYVVAWVLMALVLAAAVFLQSSRETTLASHDAILRPNLSGQIVLRTGPVLPDVRVPSGESVGVSIQLGKTDSSSTDELVDRYALIAILCVMYLILGCFLDGISMIVLTTSIVLPMIGRVGIDLLWFSIFIVLLVEIAAVTPPVGFNLFVLQTMSGKESTFVARNALPFFGMLLVAIAIITIFPQIATWLPKVVMARP